jgi:hypothetical protein
MPLRIAIHGGAEAEALGRRLEAVRGEIGPGASAVVRDWLGEVEGAIREEIDAAGLVFTGALRASFRGDVFADVVRGIEVYTGRISSDLVYAPVMEGGRRPGARQPPVDAIAPWVEAKLGSDVSAYAVARSIGRKGVRGRHYLRRALDRARDAVQGAKR